MCLHFNCISLCICIFMIRVLKCGYYSSFYIVSNEDSCRTETINLMVWWFQLLKLRKPSLLKIVTTQRFMVFLFTSWTMTKQYVDVSIYSWPWNLRIIQATHTTVIPFTRNLGKGDDQCRFPKRFYDFRFLFDYFRLQLLAF